MIIALINRVHKSRRGSARALLLLSAGKYPREGAIGCIDTQLDPPQDQFILSRALSLSCTSKGPR
jgi:hypothetical protein